MKIAIMQPYFFPYIGYFQLIKAVDLFVFYNDVNFIKRGWIHRNRILLNQKDLLFTIPCAEVSQNKRICDTRTAFDGASKKKLMSSIMHSYKRAPHFEAVYTCIESVIERDFEFVDELAMESVRVFCDFLSIPARLMASKDQYANEGLKKADRLIDICRQENAMNYINAIGGQEIYTKDYFAEYGVALQFLSPRQVSYKQFDHQFVPWLSMIDVLMFNTTEETHRLLDEYDLI